MTFRHRWEVFHRCFFYARSALSNRVNQKTLLPAYLLLVFSLNFLTKLPISQMFAANGLRSPPKGTAYSGTSCFFILSDKMTVTIAPKFLIRFDLFKIFILNRRARCQNNSAGQQQEK